MHNSLYNYSLKSNLLDKKMALECFSEAENPLLKLKSVPNLLQQDITDSISKLTEHQVLVKENFIT